MPRPARLLLNAATAASLALGLGAAAFCVWPRLLTYAGPFGEVGLRYDQGALVFGLTGRQGRPPGWSRQEGADKARRLWRGYTYAYQRPRHGFLATHWATPDGRGTWLLYAPWWAVCAPAALLPLWRGGHWTFRALASRKATDARLCAACNYDLRATPDRCPECGTIPAPMTRPGQLPAEGMKLNYEAPDPRAPGDWRPAAAAAAGLVFFGGLALVGAALFRLWSGRDNAGSPAAMRLVALAVTFAAGCGAGANLVRLGRWWRSRVRRDAPQHPGEPRGPSRRLILAFALAHFLVAVFLFMLVIGMGMDEFDDPRPPSAASRLASIALMLWSLPLVTPLLRLGVSLPILLQWAVLFGNSLIWGWAASHLLRWFQRRRHRPSDSPTRRGLSAPMPPQGHRTRAPLPSTGTPGEASGMGDRPRAG